MKIEDNDIIISNYFVYFRLLEKIYSSMDKLLEENDFFEKNYIFSNILVNLQTLFPYGYSIGMNKPYIDANDGMVSFDEDLKNYYNDIIKFNVVNKIMIKVKKVRNKYNHEPHVCYNVANFSTSKYYAGIYYNESGLPKELADDYEVDLVKAVFIKKDSTEENNEKRQVFMDINTYEIGLIIDLINHGFSGVRERLINEYDSELANNKMYKYIKEFKFRHYEYSFPKLEMKDYAIIKYLK